MSNTNDDIEGLFNEFIEELKSSEVDTSGINLQTNVSDIKYKNLDSLMFDMGVEDENLGELTYDDTVEALLLSAVPFLY